MGPPFLYGDSDTPPHLVAFTDRAGDTKYLFNHYYFSYTVYGSAVIITTDL